MKESKKSWLVPVILGLVLIGLALYRFVLPRKTRVSLVTTSTLTEAVDMATLSTAQFTYRGIADVYADPNRTNVRGHICYAAIVKAGIDEEIRFEIDEANRHVIAEIPELKLTVFIDSEQPMTVIPASLSVELPEMLRCSREDAEREARGSKELMKVAREGMETTVNSLLKPFLAPRNYTWEVRWPESEGSERK